MMAESKALTPYLDTLTRSSRRGHGHTKQIGTIMEQEASRDGWDENMTIRHEQLSSNTRCENEDKDKGSKRFRGKIGMKEVKQASSDDKGSIKTDNEWAQAIHKTKKRACQEVDTDDSSGSKMSENEKSGNPRTHQGMNIHRGGECSGDTTDRMDFKYSERNRRIEDKSWRDTDGVSIKRRTNEKKIFPM